MIPKELNDWLQVLGLFGVLGGLIFVGLQLSLDRQIAETQGTEAAAANRQYWAELVNDNADVWVKGLSGDALSETEKARFDTLASARSFSFFTSWLRAGRTSSQTGERFALELAAEIHRHPGLRRWWRETTGPQNAMFERVGQSTVGWGDLVNEELDRLERQSSTD